MKNKLREKPRDLAGELQRFNILEDVLKFLEQRDNLILNNSKRIDKQAEQIEALEETLTDNCKLIKEQDIEILALKESNNALVRIFEVTDEKSELAIKTIKALETKLEEIKLKK